MRKTATTINPPFSRVIGEPGHTDLIPATDAGLPTRQEQSQASLLHIDGRGDTSLAGTVSL